MNPDDNTPISPRIRLYRDPRDTRELLTDTLGVTVESTSHEARAGYDASTSTSNLLGQRKRERAWSDINDPIHRLVQETLLYPVEPIPEPDDPDFPVYDPQLPEPPVIHETPSAMDRLLDAVAKALPPRPEPPAPEFRDANTQALSTLPDPVFGNE